MRKLLIIGFVLFGGGSLFAQTVNLTDFQTSVSTSENEIEAKNEVRLPELYAFSNHRIQNSPCSKSNLIVDKEIGVTHGGDQGSVLKIKKEKSDIVPVQNINIFQTVKKGYMVIKGLRDKSVKLEVLNGKGNVISLRKYFSGSLASLSNFSSGIYLVRPNSGGKKHYIRKLRVR